MRSGFAAFSINLTLPVQLISFTAKMQNPSASNPTVVCNWNTASEQNSSHFIIERSNDGRNFIYAGQTAAGNNTSITQSYSFIDNAPFKGISYYRLKMFDRDGSSSLSRIAAVGTDKAESFFMLYPNPVKDETTLALSVAKKQNAVYTISDLAGKQLVSNTVSLNEGINIINLSVGYLPAGSYIIQLRGSDIIKQAQFIKQ